MSELKEGGGFLCVSSSEPMRCSLSFFSLFTHSLIHFLICLYCDSAPPPKKFDET